MLVKLLAAAPPPTARLWGLALTLPGLLLVPWLVVTQALGVRGVFGTAVGMVLALLLATATVTDLRWRRVFNWTTYSAALWAVLLSLLGRVAPEALQPALGARDLGETLASLALCLLLVFLLYVAFGGGGGGAKSVGGGDLKLLAAITVLVGFHLGVWAWVYSSLFAGVFAAGYLAWRLGPSGLLAFLLPCAAPWLARRVGGGPSAELPALLQWQLPLAPFVAAGTLAAVI